MERDYNINNDYDEESAEYTYEDEEEESEYEQSADPDEYEGINLKDS